MLVARPSWATLARVCQHRGSTGRPDKSHKLCSQDCFILIKSALIAAWWRINQAALSGCSLPPAGQPGYRQGWGRGHGVGDGDTGLGMGTWGWGAAGILWRDRGDLGWFLSGI